ncbi:MAG: transposase [Dolichospermum sp.]
MAIDEKHINGRFHTVLSNATTGKVALLCSTIKVPELSECLGHFGSLLHKINYVARDLSPVFENVCRINFPNAIHIADKFHVIRHAIEAVQAVRLRLKQEALKQQREEQLAFQKQLNDNKKSDFIGPKMKLPKGYKPAKLENGETLPELLSRSRYLCAIEEQKWNIYQQKRAKLLFDYYGSRQKPVDQKLD